MAAGDITEVTHLRGGPLGGFSNPKTVTAVVEFGDIGTGKTTITAKGS
jgi:hypothetical protein